jgi:hypothetical protein
MVTLSLPQLQVAASHIECVDYPPWVILVGMAIFRWAPHDIQSMAVPSISSSVVGLLGGLFAVTLIATQRAANRPLTVAAGLCLWANTGVSLYVWGDVQLTVCYFGFRIAEFQAEPTDLAIGNEPPRAYCRLARPGRTRLVYYCDAVHAAPLKVSIPTGPFVDYHVWQGDVSNCR